MDLLKELRKHRKRVEEQTGVNVYDVYGSNRRVWKNYHVRRQAIIMAQLTGETQIIWGPDGTEEIEP